jgi:hypothetical protein
LTGFGAYRYRTLTFAGEAIPGFGHNEQLIAVFHIMGTTRKNAALSGVPPVLSSLLQGLVPCPLPAKTNHIDDQKGTVPAERSAAKCQFHASHKFVVMKRQQAMKRQRGFFHSAGRIHLDSHPAPGDSASRSLSCPHRLHPKV